MKDADIKVVGLSSNKSKGKTNWKILGAIIGIVVLALGVIAGIILVRQQQNIQEKAAECSSGGTQCPSTSDPTLLRDCSTGEVYPNDSVCDRAGKVEVCGTNSSNARQFCCPSAGGNWTTNLSSCAVATATAISSATGTFTDVPNNSFAFQSIEALYQAGVVTGCSTNPMKYCPDADLKRSEITVILLKAKNGSSFNPATATGTVFTDVPSSYWAAAWIEKLAADGITAGCGDGKFCPEKSVTRAEAAVFFSKTFNINYTVTATATSTSRATATATTRATATATATATTNSSATATTTATSTSTSTVKPTSTVKSSATATATAAPIPITGSSWTTILGVGFGIIMILASLTLAL